MSASTATSSPPRFLEFKPPDTLFLRSGHAGGQSEADIAAIGEIFRQYGEASPFYLVVDFAGMTRAVDPKVRAQVSKYIKPDWILGCAYLNASMAMRLSIRTIHLAMFLVGKADYPSEFVASEAEALEAIARFRSDRAKKAKR